MSWLLTRLASQRSRRTLRTETGPACLVTLGLRDRGSYVTGATVRRILLDDKLFAIKGPTSLTFGTVRGRILVPFDRRLGGLFLWINAGYLPLLILIVLQGLAHGVGISIPVPIVTIAPSCASLLQMILISEATCY
jgi:hypothetical protein